MQQFNVLKDIDALFFSVSKEEQGLRNLSRFSILPVLNVEHDERKLQRQLQNNLKRKKNCWDPDDYSKIENYKLSFAFKTDEQLSKFRSIETAPEAKQFQDQ